MQGRKRHDEPEEPAPEIHVDQIDAVLRFLPRFEAAEFEFGLWVSRQGQMPFFSFSAEASAFIDAMYQQRFIISFDWPSWREKVEHYQSNAGALEGADLSTIRKLLTAHIRADRFSEGHLAQVFDQWHLTAILRRLKQIRDA